MPIDGIFMTALRHELHDKLINGRVQGVFQPRPDEVVLQIRQPGATHRLVASINPQLARAHLTAELPGNPLAPPPFCLLLRKHLIPGRVLGVVQPPMERVLALCVEGFGSDGRRSERRLIIEIMGRHSNIVLVDEESGVILDALKRIPAEVNSYREILPNRQYVPPPPQEKEQPLEMSEERFSALVRHLPIATSVAKGLQRAVAGLSPFAAKELLAAAGLATEATRGDLSFEQIDALWRTLQDRLRRIDERDITPVWVEGERQSDFWCFEICSFNGHERRFPSLQELLDEVFTRRAADEGVDRLKVRLNAQLQQHLARVDKKIALQTESIRAAEDACVHKLHGDLILANLYRLGEKDSSVRSIALPNYLEEGATVTVAIDPTLSYSDNAQSYYKRYQKARKTQLKAKEHLDASRLERDYLESVQNALHLGDDMETLEEIEAELQRQGYVKPQGPKLGRANASGKVSKPSKPLVYRSSDGFTVRVGRNNRQNDELTLRTARAHDLWFHTQEIAGAHVVVETQGADVPETTLIEAAMLAAFHSKARQSSNVPVDYTACRHVRKPKGAKPGMVIYDHQQTLFVTPEEEQATRLELPE